MYLEIVEQCVIKHIDKEKDKKDKTAIVIHLTPTFYKSLQFELNDSCKFNTLVPIQEATFTSIKLYDRTVRIESSDHLDANFEMGIVQALSVANPIPRMNEPMNDNNTEK